MDEVRRDDVRQHAPLVVRLADEAHVAHPQVPQSAVDELRRGARGRTTEVTGIDERDRKPRPGGVSRDTRADDAPTDDEQIELSRRECLERVAARVGHTRNGFDHAFRPAGSVTSMRA